jgi:hypothetical protein
MRAATIKSRMMADRAGRAIENMDGLKRFIFVTFVRCLPQPVKSLRTSEPGVLTGLWFCFMVRKKVLGPFQVSGVGCQVSASAKGAGFKVTCYEMGVARFDHLMVNPAARNTQHAFLTTETSGPWPKQVRNFQGIIIFNL